MGALRVLWGAETPAPISLRSPAPRHLQKIVGCGGASGSRASALRFGCARQDLPCGS